MDFFEALKLTLGFLKIARKEWIEDSYIYLRDGILRIMRGGVESNLIVSEADMRATDWYVL
jgi:hypothetical protein